MERSLADPRDVSELLALLYSLDTTALVVLRYIS
jgi:hypothetical protein